MSNLNISDLPFLDDIKQAEDRASQTIDVAKVKGGIRGIEELSQTVGNRLSSLGFTSLAEEAAKGPDRVKARLAAFL